MAGSPLDLPGFAAMMHGLQEFMAMAAAER